MAGSSSSSSSSSFSEYPYPSKINVGNFVSVKLTKANYPLWKAQMLSLISSQDLLAFIYGTVKAPPQSITVEEPGITRTIVNPEYEAWKRTEKLLKGWIIGSLSEECLARYTARYVWTELAKSVNAHYQEAKTPLEKSEKTKETAEREDKDAVERYYPLRKAIAKGDWEGVDKFLKSDSAAITATKITKAGQTLLQFAFDEARGPRGFRIVKNLVELMSPKQLAHRMMGRTALHLASAYGNVEAAKLVVQKAPFLPDTTDKDGTLPLYIAVVCCHRDMIKYLLAVTSEDEEAKLLESQSGAHLMDTVMGSKFYDVALHLLHRNPKLAWNHRDGRSPLEVMAQHPSSFPSGMRLNVCQRLIYSLPGMKDQALQLVKELLSKIQDADDSVAAKLLRWPFLYGAQYGIVEVVNEILKLDFSSYLLHLADDEGRNAFHLAVMYRQENVFNVLCQYFADERYRVILSGFTDRNGNNILHLAGNKASHDRHDLVSGGTLQVQRELQWFKEVEKFVVPRYRKEKNIEGKTPLMIFNEEHEKLVTSEGRWMRGMANSCIVAASLVAIVVFAAAIAVPGGNSHDGLPIFFKEMAFKIFAILDALALFSSLSSVLSFSSVLTSRYAAIDFLYDLPKRLIIGLVNLFISVTCMVIAFSAALYLVFGQGKAWVLITVATFACLPVTLFVVFQFPLLRNMIKSTYGPSIFRKPSE